MTSSYKPIMVVLSMVRVSNQTLFLNHEGSFLFPKEESGALMESEPTEEAIT